MTDRAADTTDATPTRIVVLGAGFGGVYTFKRLHQWFHKDPSVELVLISDSNYFLFTPLLHEVATGNVEPVDIVEPLRKVLGCCMAEFHLAQVCRVDSTKQLVRTTGGDVPYDKLVVALGSEPAFFGIEGAAEHVYTLKTMADAIRLKNHVIHAVESANARLNGYTPREHATATAEELAHIVVIGGGPTGVEIAAELADLCYRTLARFYTPELTSNVRITLVHRGDELVPQFTKKMRERSAETLRQKGVALRFDTAVTAVTDNAVYLDNGEKLETRTPVWTAGVAPKDLPFDRDVPREDGKLLVDKYLRLDGDPDIFAIGDMARHYDPETGEPSPALAQTASQQGAYVADVIARTMNGQEVAPFTYHHQGNLLSLGKWRAAGEIKGRAIYGRFAWWVWRTIYLSKLISFSKKVTVAVHWTINLFRPRDISQLSEIEYEDGCEQERHQGGGSPRA